MEERTTGRSSVFLVQAKLLKVGLGYAMAHHDPNITVSLSGPEFPFTKKVTLDALKFNKDSRPSAKEVARVMIRHKQFDCCIL